MCVYISILKNIYMYRKERFDMLIEIEYYLHYLWIKPTVK